MAGHVVTSAAVQVRAGARMYHLEQGAFLPEGVATGDLDRLVSEGLIEPLEDVEPETPPRVFHVVDDGSDASRAILAEAMEAFGVQAATTPKDDGDGSGGEDPKTPKRPGDNAQLRTWITYAESLGKTVPDGANRDAVIALIDADGEN